MSAAILRSLERIAPWAIKDGKLSWIARFAAICFACVLIPVLLLHGLLGLDDFRQEGGVGAAAILALFGMIAVGVGLMALVFYSSRNGMDDSVYNAHIADERDKEIDGRTDDDTGPFDFESERRRAEGAVVTCHHPDTPSSASAERAHT
jgi:hypothetical protein